MRGRPIHRLFTGHGGGGKTTELKRVKQLLESGREGARWFVSFLDADDVMDLDDVDPTDLILAVVRQLITDAREREGIDLKPGGRFKAFRDSTTEALGGVVDAGVEVKIGDPFGVAELSTTLKRQPSVRRQVRRLLEGRLPALFDAVNEELLPALLGKLAGRGYAGLLVIVDQLDRVSSDADQHTRLFWDGRGTLKALDCPVVYTAPIEYASSRALPRLENEYGELLGLPLLPLTSTDPNVRDRARACMRDVVKARMAGCGTSAGQVFAPAGALDDLLHLSGGHFRSLFSLMRTAIETSGLVAPLPADHVGRMAGKLAAKYLDPLKSEEREVVKLVHATGRRPDDDAQLDCFFDLLRDQYVFAYVVGDQRWYDWNPILERSVLALP